MIQQVLNYLDSSGLSCAHERRHVAIVIFKWIDPSTAIDEQSNNFEVPPFACKR